MNFQEITAKLAELGITPEIMGSQDQDYEDSKIVEALGKIEEVEYFGGEGMGDSVYIVNHFVDHDIYIRVDGYYSSYEGSDWDSSEFREVKKKRPNL